MDHARRAVLRHGMQRVLGWAVWSLPRPLLALWSLVVVGYLTWIVARAADFHFRVTDVALFAALVGCGAFSVEMSRRASEPTGVVKDVYAVWELPIVFLLPGIYALIVPAIRLTLTQWRVRRAPVYKRVYTAAAIGIAYGLARLVFMAVLPVGCQPRAYLWSHTSMWLVAAGCGALAQWAVNQGLILTAFKLENPAASIRNELLARETLHNDATELCAALLVAVGMTISDLTLIVALPLTTLLQRSFRHAQLLNEARADAKTGLLNAATWEREAAAEVARAIRTSSPLAVALLDLDRFKQINDTHGHLLGDEVLRQIASTMTGVLREYDLAGRFGGEEFVMLLPQTRAPDAFKIAERVREHIAMLPIGAPGGERIPVTVSIGVAALDAGSSRQLAELLAAADAALYRAKASGRDQVQMISTSRGLSAVRPADDPDPGLGPWRGGLRPGGGVLGGDGDLDDASILADAALIAAEHIREIQLPAVVDADVDGKASTASTSALVV
ncbi:GGDEF domain-containing protein [Trebonia kvetii]|uniref:GGDEF domain-containing protein n=1 Tax=Trebonia kvetii TaxID=2480626 RepID=A0A6P2BUR4_9ACTN|nr:GGDEF domain-containing protein [Trebonia kvetii]TVZ00953.1 GGDEF domain-containing protein [Trebonia kvetii]